MLFSEKLYTKKISARFLREFLKIVFAANLIAVFSHAKLFIPGNPVPFVFQSTVVLFLPFFMGRKASFAVLLFLFEGLMGFPVFAQGGGLAYLSGVTGGYLVGYFVAACGLGVWTEVFPVRKTSSILALLCFGQIVIYAFGVLHLSSFVGWGSSFSLGIFPFCLSDLGKIFLGILSLRKWLLPSPSI